jgi:ribosomal protein L44E
MIYFFGGMIIMDNMNIYCNTCKKEVNHVVVEVKEGEESWISIKVKCSECGKEHTINLYC